MIPVTIEGQERMEAQRVAQLATVQVAKSKKKGRRDREMSDLETAAHEQARGGMDSQREDEHPLPLQKTYAERGATMGPDEPVQPGHISPEQFHRPYEAEGHAAPSPGQEAPRSMPEQAPTVPQPRRVDLTSSRAVAHYHSPAPPGGE
jgi:hypothetical protein